MNSSSPPSTPAGSSPATGSKRPGDTLQDVTNGKKAKTSSIWKDRGRRFALTVNFFDSPKAIFDNGAQIASEERSILRSCDKDSDEYKEWWEDLEDYQRRYLHSYKLLRELLVAQEPTALTDLTVWENIAPLLASGVAAEKQDDTSTLKRTCIEWLVQDLEDPLKPLNPTLSARSKKGRGFAHPATGRLLCPADMTWNETTRLELLNRVDSQDAPKGSVWPRLLYRNEEMNPNNPWEGLLQHEDLVKAAKTVLIRPSSATSDGGAVSGKRGKAANHGIQQITVGFLCYIASTLRFTLTSYEEYNLSDKGLDVDGFFTSLYDLLIDPEEQEEVERLLQWWNRRIFGKQSASHGAREPGTRAFFRQARRERNASAALAAAAAA
ncbi:hypothetical protein EXIGLDRAFT_756582 [Exidia glandulosa HHB12029]|uniref:Uncharacterized protein n=1 Tax=Exidia glandulosa HHB12029 TaxID=1314781 RepID=A0A165B6V9_EXIGL|nr:hypothetical protein EXIGLDRAFT_756582 [Exidia glandulosa HHB12029]